MIFIYSNHTLFEFIEAYLIGNPLEQFTWLSRDHLNVLVYLVCYSNNFTNNIFSDVFL